MGDIADDLRDGMYCDDFSPQFYKSAKKEPLRKNHKFNMFDECTRCGVVREKVNHVGNGMNLGMQKHFHWSYSKDGKDFSETFINCNT